MIAVEGTRDGCLAGSQSFGAKLRHEIFDFGGRHKDSPQIMMDDEDGCDEP